MSYLIDTCVIAELLKSKSRKSVVDWLGACPDDSIFLSVLTLGELYKGIAKLPESRRIAATAIAHDLTVVTRNAPDIAVSGVSIFDPWTL